MRIGANLGLGSVLAFMLSYFLYKSIPWAIIHGLCGWFYIIYFILVKTGIMLPLSCLFPNLKL